jgi:hypothetical protein
MEAFRLLALLACLVAVASAQAHAIHGAVADDIVIDGQCNKQDHSEFDTVHVIGEFKTNPYSYKEGLSVLFSAREPQVSKVIYGHNLPDLDAAALFEGTPIDGAVLFDGEDTKQEQFPVDRIMSAHSRDDRVASLFEATAAELAIPIKAQYLVVDHTLAQTATDVMGNQWEIGVLPSVAKNGTTIVPNLCQLYMAPYGTRDYKPVLVNGLPIIIVFTWPRGTNYVYSNVCFEQNYFWSTGDADVNVYDGNKTKKSRAPHNEQRIERWPPTFATYGGHPTYDSNHA